jgi:hypothetical protein
VKRLLFGIVRAIYKEKLPAPFGILLRLQRAIENRCPRGMGQKRLQARIIEVCLKGSGGQASDRSLSILGRNVEG